MKGTSNKIWIGVLITLLGIGLCIYHSSPEKDKVPTNIGASVTDSLDYSMFSPDSDFLDTIPPEQVVDSLFASIAGREIEFIILHTTASAEGTVLSEELLNKIWEYRGFSRPGYPMVINPDGSVIFQRKFDDCVMTYEEMTWGAKGYNDRAIHIAWVGGYSGKDTRTKAQKRTMETILIILKMICPNAKIIGHRDTGAKKSCPNFDAIEEYKYIDELINNI